MLIYLTAYIQFYSVPASPVRYVLNWSEWEGGRMRLSVHTLDCGLQTLLDGCRGRVLVTQLLAGPLLYTVDIPIMGRFEGRDPDILGHVIPDRDAPYCAHRKLGWDTLPCKR